MTNVTVDDIAQGQVWRTRRGRLVAIDRIRDGEVAYRLCEPDGWGLIDARRCASEYFVRRLQGCVLTEVHT